jgi:4-hydroxybenzoate polyprenyltransferase
VSMPQAVLGVAFSFGIPLAFVAVGANSLGWEEISLQTLSDAVPLQAWGLTLFNLFWVLAYDTEYAMVDRDDDLRIGLKTSAITLGRHEVTAIMAFYAVYLCGWYGLLVQEKLGWHWTLALCLAGLQAVWHFLLIMDRSREGCFLAFRSNHWLGATLFSGIAVAYALR